MPIQFPCPQCRTKIQVPDEAAGKQARCPSCSSIVKVSAGSPPTRTTAPAAAAAAKTAVRCPGCSRTLNVAKASAGKVFSCPKCATKFRVPAASADGFDFSSSPGPSDPFAGIEPSELAYVPAGPASYTDVPSYRGYSGSRVDHRETWSYVVPGATILAMSVLTEAYGLFYLVTAVVQFRRIIDLPTPALLVAIGQLLFVLFLMTLHGFAINGAICMIRRVDLAAAKTAAVISCLPCSLCCIFQMGVGIWAAVSVFSDQARRDFR